MTKSFQDMKEGMSEERIKRIQARIDEIYQSLARSGTPCQGLCSTIYGDEWCQGCGRHYKEVINWNTGLTDSQKNDIIKRYKDVEGDND